ncbi:MAG: hypothetical protein WCW52_10105 [Elusimicrobiales bacterium]|jgi:hypothetical protein
MRSKELLFPLLAFPLLAACGTVAAPVNIKKEPVRVEAPAKPRLSPEDAKKVERLYYQAVDAYSMDNLEGAALYLKEISAITSQYAPARELAEKIKLAGQKTATQGTPPASTQSAPTQPSR